MNNEKKVNQFVNKYSENLERNLLGKKVAIMRYTTDTVMSVVTVEDILEGSGFYLEVKNGYALLMDIDTQEVECGLGSDLDECLETLSDFKDYFNNYPCDSEDDVNYCWYSDFHYSDSL